MQYDEVLQATLLLSCYFNSNEVKNVKPLTALEYVRFATWLHHQKLTPASLLHDQDAIMAQWQDPKKKITPERIRQLFARGASMGFALEHWDKHGVWVISRPNPLYPKSLKEKLGDARPPILFGVGNQALLSKPGIGFVGSRSIDANDEAFTQKKAELAVAQGYTVISGCAKGIDQTSMLAALACGGESVGILADSLLKTSTKKAYREGLKEQRLVLITPFYPEAGFSRGNAMGRNKYIYALSKAVVTVKSDFNKGGTWAGAKENLTKQWVPLLVRNANHEGNQELIKLGGQPIGEDFDAFADLSLNKASNVSPPQQDSLLINEPVPPPMEDDRQQGHKASQIDALLVRYGAIFRLFYTTILEVAGEFNQVEASYLLAKFPELSEAQVTTWLALLEAKGCLMRKDETSVYILTQHSQPKSLTL